MIYMSSVIQSASIPGDAGVAIEYRIPMSAKRIDFIVSGLDESNNPSVVIVELKQWQDVGITEKDAVVETLLGGAWRETTHPSYQAWTYAQLLRDFNEAIYTNNITLTPCAYLHNCTDGSAVRSDFYSYHIEKAPLFLRDEVEKLAAFIRRYVRKGDRGRVLFEIEKGVIRPSKELASHLDSLLKGNPEFVMIDEQKIAYESAVSRASRASVDCKQVLIVHGGPGTGKSVVAVNLLVEMIRRRLNAAYVTRNSAPREVYQSKLAQSMRKSRIANLFKSSGSFIDADSGAFDVLIVDEAHRLNEKTGFYNKGENQVKEIINASNLAVFFLDEDQKVTLKDIGSRDEIVKWANQADAQLEELELSSQFRCNGSDGYLAWIDNTLQIKETANYDLEGISYDFRVCSTPAELRDLIFDRNKVRNKSRLVAGYCWPWASKTDRYAMDIKFPEYGFAMQWNLTDDGMLWLVKPDSVNQIGCIHTCQGLELDYVGVIIGPDLIVRGGRVVTDVMERASQDRSVFGFGKYLESNRERALEDADAIIKNTYRVLMTRGQRGCFVWSVDPETNHWLRECMG